MMASRVITICLYYRYIRLNPANFNMLLVKTLSIFRRRKIISAEFFVNSGAELLLRRRIPGMINEVICLCLLFLTLSL